MTCFSNSGFEPATNRGWTGEDLASNSYRSRKDYSMPISVGAAHEYKSRLEEQVMRQSGTASRTRADWRTRCRKLLSEHIEKELHLAVPADQVRLITRPDDPYQWFCLAERNHLFEKQLSKHNTGAYKEICRELGQSLGVRARPDADGRKPTNRSKSGGECNQTVMKSQVSPAGRRNGPDTFISKIENLTRSNAALREAVASLKSDIAARDQLHAALQQKQKELAQDAVILQSNLESSRKELQASQARATTLDLRWRKVVADIERCRATSDSLHGQLMSVLQG